MYRFHALMSWAYMNGYMQQRGMYTRRCIFAEQLEKQKLKHVRIIINEIIGQLCKLYQLHLMSVIKIKTENQ